MPTKRTTPTAAQTAKPTTLNAAEEAGRRAHAEAVGDTASAAPDQLTGAAPPARKRMELLRAKTYCKHSEAEEEAFQREFTDLITNAISGAGSLFLQEVAQFIDIAEHDRGCATPAEEFITSMVSSHYRNGGLTPDMVAKEIDPDNVDGFYENFKCLLDERRQFDAIYGERPDVHAQQETTA
jgi:hypothetical protein